MRDHTRLRAFQLADEVVVDIYRITRTFPQSEMYGLTAQMRRAAVSVPSNIVEGSARESRAEYIRFLSIAFGSLKELHYQFELSNRLGYITQDPTATSNKIIETEKVLASLLRSLKNPTLKKSSPLTP